MIATTLHLFLQEAWHFQRSWRRVATAVLDKYQPQLVKRSMSCRSKWVMTSRVRLSCQWRNTQALNQYHQINQTNQLLLYHVKAVIRVPSSYKERSHNLRLDLLLLDSLSQSNASGESVTRSTQASRMNKSFLVCSNECTIVPRNNGSSESAFSANSDLVQIFKSNSWETIYTFKLHFQ